MASLGMTVGDVISSGAGCFQWTIHDFLSYVWGTAACLRSPNFRFSDVPYHMSLDYVRRDGPVRIIFNKNSDSLIPKLNVKLGMRTGHRRKIENRSGETDICGNFTVAAWMGFSEFLERRCEILDDGCLTVFCELRKLDTEESASVLREILLSEEKITAENEASEGHSGEEEMGSKWKTLKRMQRDLRNLLISGEDCDVTIEVQGKEFPAHRNVLRARSPVFNSMFSHETVENQGGVVVIDDCDPAIFPDFLNYVYTGSTKHISDENVFRLYTVSDKYGFDLLKGVCTAYMKSNVSIGTICDLITLALRHEETELIDLAKAFFSENLIKILKTEKWLTVIRENATLGTELVIEALQNSVNRDYWYFFEN